MSAAENLEKIVAEAFKREVDQDENVARTLPFFTATLALAISVLGYIGRDLPNFSTPESASIWIKMASLFYIALLHGAMATAAIGVAAALWFLAVAVQVREYRLPPAETELVAWVQELGDYYRAIGTSSQDVDDLVAADLRVRMTAELAEAAMHNRENNRVKMGARSQGFTTLTGVLAIAFLMAAIMFVGERLQTQQGGDGDNKAQRDQRLVSSPPRSAPSRSSKAQLPAQPSCPGGGEVPICSGSREGQVMSNDQKPTPNPQPASTPAPVKPVAPQPQYFKKNDETPQKR